TSATRWASSTSTGTFARTTASASCPRRTSRACGSRCRRRPTTGVNDATGEPLVVVTTEANAGLVQMLPDLCKEIRGLVGERRVTIVFDRGGWSPKLFQQLIADGFDILTYRKGRSRRRLRWEFREHRAVLDGREVVYQL